MKQKTNVTQLQKKDSSQEKNDSEWDRRNKYEVIEQYDFKEITNKYNLNDSIVTLVFKNQNTVRVLSRISINDNLILKNQSFPNTDINNLDQIISENNLEWVNEGWISRANELPYDVTSLSFTLAKPEEGRHTYSAESANRFTSLVIDLAGVRTPEGDSDTGISTLYLSQENNEMFVSLIKQLRENAEIKVFTDLL